MDQLHPWRSTIFGAITSLCALYLCKPFQMGTKTHHIQLKVISVLRHTVIPPELSNIFFSQKVFAKQGKDKTATVMILHETLRKDIFCLKVVVRTPATEITKTTKSWLGGWTDRWALVTHTISVM